MSHSWELKGLTSQSSNFKCPRGLQEEEGGGDGGGRRRDFKAANGLIHSICKSGEGGGGEEEENLKFLGSQKGAYLLQLF